MCAHIYVKIDRHMIRRRDIDGGGTRGEITRSKSSVMAMLLSSLVVKNGVPAKYVGSWVPFASVDSIGRDSPKVSSSNRTPMEDGPPSHVKPASRLGSGCT